jgi:hypothetical protein
MRGAEENAVALEENYVLLRLRREFPALIAGTAAAEEPEEEAVNRT